VRRLALVAVLALALCGGAAAARSAPSRISRVVDGDTVYLTNGAKIRLVQIDTPEVYFGVECWGRQASAATKQLLPPGTRVRLAAEPATDRVDRYGRLLRYVIRARDGLNVNLYLVAHGDAAPYYYDGRRGRYAATLDRLARSARARKLGLWGACPGTPVDFDRGVDTGPGPAR
jgi:endonuclease YncB( thermonuclease family)